MFSVCEVFHLRTELVDILPLLWNSKVGGVRKGVSDSFISVSQAVNAGLITRIVRYYEIRLKVLMK